MSQAEFSLVYERSKWRMTFDLTIKYITADEKKTERGTGKTVY